MFLASVAILCQFWREQLPAQLGGEANLSGQTTLTALFA